MQDYNYPYNKLTDYFIRNNPIDFSGEYEIDTVSARDLIQPKRFDIIAKWIYIDAREKCRDILWGVDIYKGSIDAFSAGTFVEPGTESKDSFEKYIRDFDNIIEDIKQNGFDEAISLIPVGKDNIILDGSHRVAAAAYYNKTVRIIRFNDIERCYDYRFFKNMLMSERHMDCMASYYTHINKNCYMACIWPAANRRILSDGTVIENALKNIGEIVYVRDVYLTYEGMHQFMIHLYGAQAWVGSLSDNYRGAYGKVNDCYRKGIPIKTYLFQADSFEQVIEAKSKIREIFGIENSSIHISDSQEETQMMTDMLYNENSLMVMNFGNPFKYKTTLNRADKYLSQIEEKKLDKNRFIIDSCAILDICGLREARDLDYLTDYIESENNALSQIDDHRSQLKYYCCDICDLLYNPFKHFKYGSLKYVSVQELKEMKERRAEPKDIWDVELCTHFLKKINKIPARYRSDINEKILDFQRTRGRYYFGKYSLRRYLWESRIEVVKRPVKFLRWIIKKLGADWSVR